MSASTERIWNIVASRPKFVFSPTFIFCSPICSNNCGVVFLWKYILVFEKWFFSFDRSNMQIFIVNITRVVWPHVTNLLDLRSSTETNAHKRLHTGRITLKWTGYRSHVVITTRFLFLHFITRIVELFFDDCYHIVTHVILFCTQTVAYRENYSEVNWISFTCFYNNQVSFSTLYNENRGAFLWRLLLSKFIG